MNFSDNIKKYVVDGAIKKETLFDATFVSKESLKIRVNALREIKYTFADPTTQEIIEEFCNLMESFIDSVPVVTIKIDK